MTRRQTAQLLAALAVALLTFAVFIPALHNGFVRWDDQVYVYENAHIQSLDASFLKWAFFDFSADNWHPLTWISYALDYAVWGYNPLGYHLTNIVLHAINAFLVVLLISELASGARDSRSSGTDAVWIGAAAGILFGIHPLHVESVAWASERKDVLCALFFLSSLICYVRYASAAGKRRLVLYWSTFALYLLSLMSKPMAITLPVVFMLLDIYPLRRDLSFRGLLLEKLPFFLAACGSAGLTLAAQQHPIAGVGALGAGERLLVAIRGFVFYIEKFFLPVGLVHFYALMPPVEVSWSDAVSCAAIASIVVFGVIQWRKGKRLWLTGWGYYAITLAPVLGIVQVGQQAAADRYTYLPLLGIIVLVSSALAGVRAKIVSSAIVKVVSAILIVLCVGLLSYATVQQIGTWKDTFTLWDHDIRFSPVHSPRMYEERGMEFVLKGNYNKAIADFDAAIGIAPPGYPIYDSYYNRGLSFFLTGRTEQAMRDFEKTLQLKPDHQDAAFYRALAFAALQKKSAGAAR